MPDAMATSANGTANGDSRIHGYTVSPLVSGVKNVGWLLEQNTWLQEFVNDVLQRSDLVLRQSRRRDIYDRMRYRDPEISGAYEQLIWPIKGSEARVLPRKRDDTPDGAKRAQILTDMLADGPGYEEILESILEIPWRGYGGVELRGTYGGLGEPSKGEPRLVGAVEIPPEALTFHVDGAPRMLTNDLSLTGITLDKPEWRWKFCIATWGSTKGGNWFGTGLAQRIYWLWMFMNQNWRDWNKALEKFAMPTLKATVTRGNFKGLKPTIMRMFRDYISDAGVALPEGIELDLLNPNARSFPGYEKMYEVVTTAIRKGLLGVTLTMDPGDRGSQSLGRVHGRMLTDRQWAVVRWVQRTLSNSLIRYLAEAEFGQYNGERLEIQFEEREDERLALDKIKTAAGFSLPVQTDEVYDRLSLTRPEGLPDVMTLQAMPGLPTDPGGAPATHPGPTGPPAATASFAEGAAIIDARNETRRLAELEGVQTGGIALAARAISDAFPEIMRRRAKSRDSLRGTSPQGPDRTGGRRRD